MNQSCRRGSPCLKKLRIVPTWKLRKADCLVKEQFLDFYPFWTNSRDEHDMIVFQERNLHHHRVMNFVISRYLHHTDVYSP